MRKIIKRHLSLRLPAGPSAFFGNVCGCLTQMLFFKNTGIQKIPDGNFFFTLERGFGKITPC